MQTVLAGHDGSTILVLDARARKLVVDSSALEISAAIEGVNAEQWLLEQLSQDSVNGFSADEKFSSLVNIVSDNDLQPATYSKSLARYITQKTFACSEPLYYQYFQQRYYLYEQDIACDSAVPFNVLSRYNANNVVYVDPKLLREIHIVFASKDDNIMSQFGHISLRLVICPAVSSSKAECDANLYQHIVLGYMAHVDEIKINQLKGLLGDYKAYLYANSFMDVYQKYTISEFRDIYSLPLKMSQPERENMLRALAEIHWGYAGDYKFVTRNCSSLMQMALAGMWPDFAQESALQSLYWRPDSFFKQLQKLPISKGAALDNLNTAEENGYYFASTEAIYQKAFEVVNAAMQGSDYASLDAYINANPMARYANARDNHAYMQSLETDNHLLQAQLLLEELSFVRLELLVNAEMGYFFEQHGIEEIETHMRKNLDNKAYAAFSECVLAPMQEIIQPKKRSNGIPNAIEISQMAAMKNCQKEDKAKLLKQVNMQLEAIDPKKWGTVKVAVYYWLAIVNNINSYKALRSEP